jgi:hypothetical protein
MARPTILTTLFLAVALVGGSAAYGAELATWDQEKVTAIAGDLSQAAQELRDALRRVPAPTVGGRPGRRAFFALREEVQVLASASRRLHTALGEGAGLDETYPTYRRLLVTARRGERELRRVGLGEPVSGKIKETADAIRRIRPFYEAEPPL